MLRKENFIGEMDWFYICILFILWNRNVWIDGAVRWKIDCVVNVFFDINAVVFPRVLLSHLDELKNSDIGSFLDLSEQTFVEPRASVKCMQLFNC
jgi:hypothetical protein